MHGVLAAVQSRRRCLEDELFHGSRKRGSRDVADPRTSTEARHVDLRCCGTLAESADIFRDAVRLAGALAPEQRADRVECIVRGTVVELDLDLPETPYDVRSVDHAHVVQRELGNVFTAAGTDVPDLPDGPQFGDGVRRCAAQIGGRELEEAGRHRALVTGKDVLLASERAAVARDGDLERPALTAATA